MTLKVEQHTIESCLVQLQKGNWKVPGFQRDFEWSQQQVTAAAESIVKSRPIGMLTLWSQPEGDPAKLREEPISLAGVKYPDGESIPNPALQHYILDGRQRLTTLAILFGGLRSPDDRYNFSGHWYLNLDADNEGDPIIEYKKSKEHKELQLNQLSNQLTLGLLPLGNLDSTRKCNKWFDAI